MVGQFKGQFSGAMEEMSQTVQNANTDMLQEPKSRARAQQWVSYSVQGPVQWGDGTLHMGSIRRKAHPLPQNAHSIGQYSSGAMERYTWVRFAGNWRKCRRGFKRRALCTGAYPPVMFNPISSAVPPDCMLKTRLAPMALSTTAPGTSASMIRARLMQTADPVHMSLVSSYVPAASKILSTALLPTAAVNSPTVLAATSFRCRPCRRRVCVIAGLRVSGMPASTGRREQSVCFFAGGRESRIRMPGESCRRWTRGREADWQRRGAHLDACGADSLLVLRHSQRPGGDARRRLLLCRLRNYFLLTAPFTTPRASLPRPRRARRVLARTSRDLGGAVRPARLSRRAFLV